MRLEFQNKQQEWEGLAGEWVWGREEEDGRGRRGACSQTEKDVQHLPKKIVLPVWMPVELRNHVINI